jgi:hypothetical protein
MADRGILKREMAQSERCGDRRHLIVASDKAQELDLRFVVVSF